MVIQDMDYKEAAAELARHAEALGLSIDCAFVPYSQSRNAKEKWQSLNWRVTLKRNGREILTTDYSQGVAHCPAYNIKGKYEQADAIAIEIEKGRIAKKAFGDGRYFESRKPITPPSFADVLYSLCIDSDVLNYANYEQWADNLGYDPDSRKGEAIYRQCLGIALTLRAAIGDAEMNELCQLAAMM